MNRIVVIHEKDLGVTRCLVGGLHDEFMAWLAAKGYTSSLRMSPEVPHRSMAESKRAIAVVGQFIHETYGKGEQRLSEGPL